MSRTLYMNASRDLMYVLTKNIGSEIHIPGLNNPTYTIKKLYLFGLITYNIITSLTHECPVKHIKGSFLNPHQIESTH